MSNAETASDKMTQVILDAWDEIEGETAPEASSETAEPVDTQDGEEAEDEVVSDEEVEEPEEAPEEPGEEEEVEVEEPSEEEAEEEETPSGDEEETPATALFSDDPEAKAFLARHGGNVEDALKAAARFESVLGRQGRELGQLRERNQQLEAELEQARLFAQDGGMLTVEQQAWVEEAVGSGNALGYIQSAMREGEYDLARAILEQGEFSVGQAMRIAQALDRAEGQAQQTPVEQQPLAHGVLMDVLVEHYPEMPKFEAEMVTTMHALGPEHPVVALAHSQDPGQAAQGIIGLYEIARAKTATVTSTREEVKERTREAAAAVRKRAVVSSGSATPPQAQVARNDKLMPGLTLEALDAEFDRQAQE